MTHISWLLSQPCATAKSLQLCPTLCDPVDSSPLGSPIPGMLWARRLEWVAISSSNAWKWKVKVKLLSRVRLCDSMDCSLPSSFIHGIFQARVPESQPCSTSQLTIILPKIISQISTCMWIPVSALLLGEPSLTQLWKTKQRLRSCSKLEVRRHTGARERHGLGSNPRWWWGWGATNGTVRRISKIWL